MARYGSPVPSSPGDNLKVALGVGAIGLILFFICLGTFNQGSGGGGSRSGSGGRDSISPRTPRATPLIAGSTALIRSSVTDFVLVAASRDAYDRMWKLMQAKDTVGLTRMALVGQVWTIQNETPCLVIDPGLTVCEVRLLDGDWDGEAGFVSRAFVKRK